MKTVVTKGEYARLKGRSPAAVSNWIADGRISAAALIGDGNRARIWVEQADADLARNLDPTQQWSQRAPIDLRLEARPAAIDHGAAYEVRPSSRVDQAAVDDDDIRRRRRADADKAEHDAEAARRRNAVDEGRWMEAAAGQREWARELGRVISDIETFLASTLAHSLAEKYGLDWKELSVELRRAFRQHRTAAADGAGREREQAEIAAHAPQPAGADRTP